MRLCGVLSDFFRRLFAEGALCQLVPVFSDYRVNEPKADIRALVRVSGSLA